MLKDDGLDYENRPVKHGITREEHLAIRDAYFESKRQKMASEQALFAEFVRALRT